MKIRQKNHHEKKRKKKESIYKKIYIKKKEKPRIKNRNATSQKRNSLKPKKKNHQINILFLLQFVLDSFVCFCFFLFHVAFTSNFPFSTIFLISRRGLVSSVKIHRASRSDLTFHFFLTFFHFFYI